jgi:uncharacterized protein YndB with AHSA1/START domain
MNLIAKATVSIQAPASKVWQALTDPEMIRQYFYGTEVITDWKVGSQILWKGEWEGKEYLEKGTILKSEPPRLLQYTYFSSLSQLEDAPENYANITYALDEDEGTTTLTVRQENIADENEREQSEKNWAMVLGNMKQLLEEEPALKK